MPEQKPPTPRARHESPANDALPNEQLDQIKPDNTKTGTEPPRPPTAYEEAKTAAKDRYPAKHLPKEDTDSDDDMPGLIPLKRAEVKSSPTKSKTSIIFKKATKIHQKCCICTVNADGSVLKFRAYTPSTSQMLQVDIEHDDEHLAQMNFLDKKAIANRFANDSKTELTKEFLDSFVCANVAAIEGEAASSESTGNTHQEKTAQTEPVMSSTVCIPKAHVDAKEHKRKGNQSFKDGNMKDALSYYTQAVECHPSQLVYHLNRAAAQLELQEQDGCLSSCKKVISACRSWQYRIRVASKAAEKNGGEQQREMAEACALATDGKDLAELTSRAYARMGSAYKRQGKLARSTNAFMLSLKEKESTEVRARLQECLQVHAHAAASSQEGDSTNSPSGTDIEDYLTHNWSMGYSEKLKFECTGCGECCRSSDHIMLTPYDLFMMTRAPNMGVMGVRTTWQLRSHANYKTALKYTLKDNLPVCFLRPAKNTQDGHCFFAYPLYKNGQKELLDFDEVQRHQLGSYVPVHPSEYNLTEEEENMTEEEMRAIQSEGESESEESDCDGGSESETASEGSEGEEDFEPTMNSYGKQALACMFGVKHMPTMCATYPMAREISWADFWHVHDEKSTSADTLVNLHDSEEYATQVAIHSLDMRARARKQQLAQNKYVVVHAAGCEGFYEDGQTRTHAFPGSERNAAKEQTIQQFLNGEADVAGRWDHNDWFLGLMQQVTDRGLDAKFPSFSLRRKFIEQLGKIWYNFDGTRAGRSRAFKSFARVKKTIETLTSCLLDATERFLDGETPSPGGGVDGMDDIENINISTPLSSSNGNSEPDQVAQYEELIKRLNI